MSNKYPLGKPPICPVRTEEVIRWGGNRVNNVKCSLADQCSTEARMGGLLGKRVLCAMEADTREIQHLDFIPEVVLLELPGQQPEDL